MKAGFGAAVITPALPVHLAGFGDRTEPVDAVHDDLEARALYLSHGDTVLCLISCDLLGMSVGYSRPARAAVADALGIEVDAVLTSCTHTHQGPSTMAGTEAIGWPNPEGYTDVLRDGCVAAATQAQANAEDATAWYARAPLPDGFAFNRRGSDYPDPWFAVLDIRTPDGARIGTVANFGIHPVLMGPIGRAVATDWVGPFRRELERLAGGFAIELTGAQGDINPVPPRPGADDYEVWATIEETEDYGRRLAAVVAPTLDDAQPLDASLAVVRATERELAIGGTLLSMLAGTPTVQNEFVEWQIGGVRIVAIPGEGFHELGRQISAARGDRVLLAGLAPSLNGYLPEPWGEGYEEGISYGQGFVAATRDVLLDVP